MLRTPLLLLLWLAFSGCTWNVTSFDRVVPIPDDDPAAVDRVRVDDLYYPAAVDGADVVVRGSARADLGGTIRVSGLVGANVRPDDVVSGVSWAWPSGGDTVRELLLGYHGPSADSVRFESIALEFPIGVGLDLTADRHQMDIDVAGLEAPVFVATDLGRITVRDATEVILESAFGAIDVVADHGTIDAEQGSVVLRFTGAARVLGGGGDVRATFGAGGEVTTRGGSVSVVLEGPLTEDLTISSEGGAVDVTLPDDVAAELHVTSQSGDVSVRLGDVTADASFEGVVNGGGPHLVTIGSGTGAVSVHRPGA